MPRPRNVGDIARARSLRQAMSLPEVLLWQVLKRQDQVKLRRQHPIGPYVLDLYCPAARLCVEIDGHAHDTGNRPERDDHRDRWLARQGIKVLRIPARDVLARPDEVADALIRMCLR